MLVQSLKEVMLSFSMALFECMMPFHQEITRMSCDVGCSRRQKLILPVNLHVTDGFMVNTYLVRQEMFVIFTVSLLFIQDSCRE